jgi:hypothetical protein
MMMADLDSLEAAVDRLAVRASENAAAIREGAERQVEDRATAHRSARRLLIALVALLLVVLVGFGVFGYRAGSAINCMNARTGALSGPSNERINYLLQAFAESAGATKGGPVSAAKHKQLIAGLDKDRKQYPRLPAHKELVKTPDAQLLALSHLISSLRAQDAYLAAYQSHPICELF